MARYLIGIDLGTTNSALAYIDLHTPAAGGRLEVAHLPRAAARRRRRRGRPAAAAVVPLPAGAARPAGRGRRPCRGTRHATYAVGEFARNHGGQDPRPARQLRQVVAVPRRRRSLRAAAAVERPARRAAHLARRGVHALPAPPGRELELRHGQDRPRGPARKAGRRADRAGVVRRRGPQPDRRGGGKAGLENVVAAGGAAGGVLLLAGHAPAATRRHRSSRARAAWSWTSAAAPATSA